MRMENDLGRDPIRQLVLRIAIPSMLAQFVSVLYSVVDRMYIGNIPEVGNLALAGAGVCGPIVTMIGSVAFLVGVGGSPLVSIRMGAGDNEGAKRILANCFVLLVGLAAALMALAYATRRPVLMLFGASEASLPYAETYYSVYLTGTVFALLSTGMNQFIICQGFAKKGMLSVMLGAVLNIVLDPFFILPQYMNMGAAGAGLATAISNTAGTLFFLLCLLRRSSTVLSLRPCHLKHTGVYIREILSIGFPSALQYALTVVSLAVLSLFVSKYAVEAVAAYGIVKKLDNLPLYFSLGTSAGLLPFLSYNYASGDRERQRQGFVFGVSITVGFSLTCVIVFELFAPQLARLFIQDDVTVAYAAAFLRRMVLCMPFVAICHPMITQFQAMGRTRESLICSILRKGSLDIPLLLLLDRLYPLYGCALVQPVVDLISLIVALVLYRRLRRTSVV